MQLVRANTYFQHTKLVTRGPAKNTAVVAPLIHDFALRGPSGTRLLWTLACSMAIFHVETASDSSLVI